MLAQGAVLVCAEAALFDKAAQCAGENFGLQQEVQQRRLAHLIATGAAQELASAGKQTLRMILWWACCCGQAWNKPV